MSAKIVTDICPPPEWNLTEEDIHQMVDELKSYYQDFKPAFGRRDQAVQFTTQRASICVFEYFHKL